MKILCKQSMMKRILNNGTINESCQKINPSVDKKVPLVEKNSSDTLFFIIL